jgi:hypothetical protein
VTYSPCVECNRYAAAYHGSVAYCCVHLAEARRESPDAHRCVECNREQPGNVAWFRSKPCGECRRARRKVTP